MATNLYVYKTLLPEAPTPAPRPPYPCDPHSPSRLSHKASKGTPLLATVTCDLMATSRHEFCCRLISKGSGAIKTGLLDAKENQDFKDSYSVQLN